MSYWYNKNDKRPYATIRYDGKPSNCAITFNWVVLADGGENYLYLIGESVVASGISQAQAKEPPLCRGELIRFDIYKRDFETEYKGEKKPKQQTWLDKFLCAALPKIPVLGEGQPVSGKFFCEVSDDRFEAYLNGQLKLSRVESMLEDLFIVDPNLHHPVDWQDKVKSVLSGSGGGGGGGNFASRKSASEILDEKLKWFIDKHPDVIEIHRLIDAVGQTTQEKAFLAETFHRLLS